MQKQCLGYRLEIRQVGDGNPRAISDAPTATYQHGITAENVAEYELPEKWQDELAPSEEEQRA